MEHKKLKDTRLKLVTDDQYIEAFRKNIRMYDIPLRELSEKADIPYETLKSFLYGNTQECKLSFAIKLAKALDCSVDELVGANTISQEAKESMAMLSKMPPQFTKYIRWAIRNNYARLDTHPLDKCIAVMNAEMKDNLIATTNIQTTEIKAPDEIIAKTFLGIRMPCDDYIPHYYQGDIICLANDRKPKQNEHMVVALNKSFWIVREDNGSHRTLTDNRINNNAYYMGYICYVWREV